MMLVSLYADQRPAGKAAALQRERPQARCRARPAMVAVSATGPRDNDPAAILSRVSARYKRLHGLGRLSALACSGLDRRPHVACSGLTAKAGEHPRRARLPPRGRIL